MTNPGVLTLIGFLVGSFGTLIGAGGGFILVPFLLFLYPTERPDVLTSTSLAVVFFNSLSGSIAYARKGRIDFRSGIIFSIASIPGAVIGAKTISHISRTAFEPIFGCLLILAGSYLLFKSKKHNHPGPLCSHKNGRDYNLVLGIAVSIGVGFISSFLGIGGGIIHVPMLVHLLDFPVHIATATSHFVLAVMAFVGTGVHLYQGVLSLALDRVFYLSAGAIIGAQLGAKFSTDIEAHWIIRGLALALLLVGIRLLIKI